jgi:hypothetical protein
VAALQDGLDLGGRIGLSNCKPRNRRYDQSLVRSGRTRC